MNTRLRFCLIYLWLVFACPLMVAQKGTTTAHCPLMKVEVDSLPPLNIPRAGHAVFYVNGELTVSGGHTSGFVPTPTAEYYKDGEWHVIQMVYNHDFGMSVVLKSGKVLLAGGVSDNIGVGQTYTAELYDPLTHTFNGFGSMELKRAGFSALELDSGRVVVSGNWYHNDGIEVFDGQKRFIYIKDVAVQRSTPHIFRINQDDALIVGGTGVRGDSLFTATADRLKGDTIHVPLLETWYLPTIWSHRDAECFIGNESKSEYIYLLPVQDSSGQVAIAKVDNGDFSLLPTEGPVPTQCQGEGIEYSGHITVDHQAQRAYMMGISSYFRTSLEKSLRFYFLCIDYAKVLSGQSAPLTLYYTDPLPFIPDYPPILTPEGDLVMAGGLTGNSNFTPSKYVLLFHLTTPAVAAAQGHRYWLWVALAVVLMALLLVFVLLKRRQAHREDTPQCECGDDNLDNLHDSANDELMQRIRELLEQQKIYTNANLKVSDIAVLLGVNSRYVSECIKQNEGCSVSQFINQYRLEHAKWKLRSESEIKLSSIWLEAGFASEQSFYRIFKQYTGQTPNEWKNNA